MKKKLAKLFKLSPQRTSLIKGFLPEKEPILKGKNIILVCEPNLRGREKKYLNSAFLSTWISSSGKYVEKFENKFAQVVAQARYAVAVNSGTTALHLILAALDVKQGDEVILPAFTMVATVNAVSYTGAQPILVDSNQTSWNIDPNQIERKISSKTKAIIVVHTYGLPVEMKPILNLAKRYHLWVIEDAAEAHGAKYFGKNVGSLGDAAAFSCYANKTITTGEGGVAVTNNPQIAKRLRLLRNHAFSKERHFWHSMLGFGYKLTNLQAAIGLAQIERFSQLVNKKHQVASWYREYLKSVIGIVLPAEFRDRQSSNWMFGILVDEQKYGMNKNKLRKILADHGIETRSFFIPIHFQPIYFKRFRLQRYPVAETLCRDGLYLPSSTLLTKKQVDQICNLIKFYSRNS